VNATGSERAKAEIRARVRALRDAIPEDRRARLGAEIRERFLALPEVGRARVVMAFWSFGSEVPTGPIMAALHERGVRLALPRVAGRDLEARAYAPGDPVTFAAFGAGEPAEGAPVRPGAIDLVLTPGLAFDTAGRRIGYGGGYYDRFLPTLRGDAARVGVAFDVQVLDEPLPAGEGDVGVAVLVTESRVLRFGAAR
jgi:5-formyltetrahydrofolate cyclo-ligase